MIKAAIVLFCAFVAVYGADKTFKEEVMEKMAEAAEACQKETKASDDDIQALVDKKVPSTHEGQCMLACLHIKFSVQNEDGSINKEGAKTFMEPLKSHNEELYAKTVTVMENCAEKVTVDADKCVTAANMMKCGLEEAKKIGLDSNVF